MTDELATFRASTAELNRMIEQSSVGYHKELYILVINSKIRVLMQTGGRKVVSFCEFEESYFEEVSGEAEAIIPVGGSVSDEKGFIDYMNFSGSGTTEITLLGDEESKGKSAPLATHWQAEGALNTKLRLPASEDDIEAIPFDHAPRWTDENEYCSKQCLVDGSAPVDESAQITGPSVIETDADTIVEQIIEPADFADGVNSYPIATEDGSFVLDVEGQQRNDSIWGEVDAESVDGPDISREFEAAFDDVFKALSGPVRLQTAPESAGSKAPPITVVQDQYSSKTIRHLIGGLV